MAIEISTHPASVDQPSVTNHEDYQESPDYHGYDNLRLGRDELEKLERQISMEAFSATQNESVTCGVLYVLIVSNKKGKSRGKNRKPSVESRKRKQVKEFELVNFGTSKRWITYRDGEGRLDGLCPTGVVEEVLLEDLRYRHDGLKVYEKDLKINKDGKIVPVLTH